MLLTLREVSKTYWRGRQPVRVLERISLDIAPGEVVAVSGATRAGKTTLLRVAAGLEPPDEGTICFDGQALSSPSSRRFLWPRARQGGPSPRVEGLERRMGWVRRSGPSSATTSMLSY